MKKIVHYLRKQPEKTKKHILHLVTTICAILLLTLWVYSLGTSLSDADTQAKIKEDLKPFSVLKDNIPSVW